jgi:hypothetical protein
LKFALSFFFVTILLAALTFVMGVNATAPSDKPSVSHTSLHYKKCHLVDSEDIADDKKDGDDDSGYNPMPGSLPSPSPDADEWEFKCVGEKRYQAIRHRLGLK